MTFHINPKARFNNGDPVLAADVKYSFDTLMAKRRAAIQVHLCRGQTLRGDR